MLDYYSSHSQPPHRQRAQDVLDALGPVDMDKKKLLEIVDKVVANAPQYSLSGYQMFGRTYNLNATRDKIHEYMRPKSRQPSHD